MKTTAHLNQTLLAIALLLISVLAFGQNNENTFSKNPLKSIRSDYNKSNPVMGLTVASLSESDYQVESTLTDHNYKVQSSYSSRNVLEDLSVKHNDESIKEPASDGLASRQLSNYPNPFSEKTIIEYEVDREAYVNLSVFYNGQLVRILASDFHHASKYRVTFSGMGLPAGTYTAVLTVNGQVLTKSMYKVR